MMMGLALYHCTSFLQVLLNPRTLQLCSPVHSPQSTHSPVLQSPCILQYSFYLMSKACPSGRNSLSKNAPELHMRLNKCGQGLCQVFCEAET